MIIAMNMMTGDERVYFGVAPENAVLWSYEQSRGNYNTLDYPPPQDHPEFREGMISVSCGEWAAMKVRPIGEDLSKLVTQH